MFWRWLFHRRSVFDTLNQVAKFLPLKDFKLSRLPTPTVAGDYFGFRLTLEGKRKGEGYRFLATVELPKKLSWRLFVCHEKRKTSFKPIANLHLVTTTHARFNQNFLLLASEEEKAKAIFQNYLCGKFVALPENDWQLDVHDDIAHVEIFESRLNHAILCDVLKRTCECLNALLIEGQLNQA